MRQLGKKHQTVIVVSREVKPEEILIVPYLFDKAEKSFEYEKEIILDEEKAKLYETKVVRVT